MCISKVKEEAKASYFAIRLMIYFQAGAPNCSACILPANLWSLHLPLIKRQRVLVEGSQTHNHLMDQGKEYNYLLKIKISMQLRPKRLRFNVSHCRAAEGDAEGSDRIGSELWYLDMQR